MNSNNLLGIDRVISEIEETKKKKKLLLHSCCAPCSSVCLERLTPYFDIYDYFYNPNITEENEYRYRYDELVRLAKEIPHNNDIYVIDGGYDNSIFFEKTKGYETCPERGERCKICFELRLKNAAKKCKELNLDYFATTLTLSPLKDFNLLNEIGLKVAEAEGVSYLSSNFKKKNGYLRSIELSKEYNLYRQNYCGCVFSKQNIN